MDMPDSFSVGELQLWHSQEGQEESDPYWIEWRRNRWYVWIFKYGCSQLEVIGRSLACAIYRGDDHVIGAVSESLNCGLVRFLRGEGISVG